MRVSVHGPRAGQLCRQLVEVGLSTRILHAPAQLPLGGWAMGSLVE
jgi:predicted ABC-type transport system involved in lysophospholipase L1 biosynthesis ATPase subunit